MQFVYAFMNAAHAEHTLLVCKHACQNARVLLASTQRCFYPGLHTYMCVHMPCFLYTHAGMQFMGTYIIGLQTRM
jgi:hypothetical protein